MTSGAHGMPTETLALDRPAALAAALAPARHIVLSLLVYVHELLYLSQNATWYCLHLPSLGTPAYHQGKTMKNLSGLLDVAHLCAHSGVARRTFNTNSQHLRY